MSTFSYKGRNRAGVVVSGKMEANDQPAAVTALRAQGILPTTIRQEMKAINLSIKFGSGIKTKDLAVFTRQFATMINAGLPMVQCLEILGQQTENKALMDIINEVRLAVEGGSTLANALRKHPKLFGDLFIHMVEAGETGGVLDVILNRLAGYIEKDESLRKKVKGAMAYPTVVSTFAIMIASGIILFVIPAFEDMFASFVKLPGPTQFLLNLSKWARKYILFVLFFVGASIAGFIWYRRTPKGQVTIDGLMLKLPIVGLLLRKVAVSKFTRTLGTLISSGVPILDALVITAKTAGNKVIQGAVMKTRSGIQEGQTIAVPLKATDVFPPMVTQMIAVGEETGALDEMLNKIADFYDEEVDTAVDALTSMIEPLLMIFIGVMVGGIIIALFLPILTMATAVGQ